jgi:hypothetical protein
MRILEKSEPDLQQWSSLKQLMNDVFRSLNYVHLRIPGILTGGSVPHSSAPPGSAKPGPGLLKIFSLSVCGTEQVAQRV